MKKVAMIGEGAWGTAISLLLADNGYHVALWCQDPAVAHDIHHHRVNKRYFPDVNIPNTIQPVTDMAIAVDGVEYIFEAIPVKYMRSVFTRLRPQIQQHQTVIVLSKGIEQKTLLLPTALINEVVGFNVAQAVLVGPSFAREVAQKSMTAVTLSCSPERASTIESLLNNSYFHTFHTTDIIGVQVNAALKNVIALGVGLAQGAGMGENAAAFLITRGLYEMAQVASALGGEAQTTYGLSGLGDLVLSARSEQGRNAMLGRLLGQGKSLEECEQSFGVLPESSNTVRSLYQLMKQKNIAASLCQGIYEVVYEGKKIGDAVASSFAKGFGGQVIT